MGALGSSVLSVNCPHPADEARRRDCKAVADFAGGGDDRVVCDNLAGRTNDKSEAGRVELLRGGCGTGATNAEAKQKSSREGVPGGKKGSSRIRG